MPASIFPTPHVQPLKDRLVVDILPHDDIHGLPVSHARKMAAQRLRRKVTHLQVRRDKFHIHVDLTRAGEQAIVLEQYRVNLRKHRFAQLPAALRYHPFGGTFVREVFFKFQVYASVKQRASQAVDETLRAAGIGRIQVFRFGKHDQTFRHTPWGSHAKFTRVHESQ